MKYFTKLKAVSWNTIIQLRQQLEAHPELWNERQERTAALPFRGTSDIWVRANDDRPFRDGKKPWRQFNDEHYAIWYPAAMVLPSVRPLVAEVMAQVRSENLGSVLITKIPIGCSVKPHVDFGWHREFFNVKVYVPIYSNSRVWNCAGEGKFVDKINMMPGETWQFDNSVIHSVRNEGESDRVTLIISMRVAPL